MTDIPQSLLTYITGLKTHDVPMVASAVSEDLAFVTPLRTLSKSQFLEMLQALYTAFPDWQYDHNEPEKRQDEFAIRWRQGGTHSGPFTMPGVEPIEATGRTVSIPEQYFFYKLGEKIVEIRPDPTPGGAPGGILEQIGVTGTL